jgi:Ala-tRNA(Pro) deacylase
MVKTLFLCNSNKTDFYLFITTADKPFKSKEFSKALDISRVSFAPAELMKSILGVKIGAATVFGILMDKENLVQVVFDKDVLLEEWYGCSDGTTTGYMRVKTKLIVNIPNLCKALSDSYPNVKFRKRMAINYFILKTDY